jgi:hypothetical protein
MHTPLLAGGFPTENVPPDVSPRGFPRYESYSINPVPGVFVETQAHKEASMFQRLYQVHEVAQDTQEVATARKIAAIVAALTIPTIARSEIAYRALPVDLEAKLVGYLQGFCVPICAAWQINDPDVQLAATGLVINLIFPGSQASLSYSVDGAILGSEAFSKGVEAGHSDGELYRTTGRKGTTLLQILASDFRGFCDYSKVAAGVHA